MSSNFNFYVNRQGVQGQRGAKGEQGFSPVISVESQTANEYILKVENEDGSFTTPNLRGNAIENNGGTYIRFNPDTEQMYTGYADGATTEQAGVVRMGTYEDLVAGESEEAVPNVADVHTYVQNSIGDIGGVVTTEQFNTYTSETAITLDNLSNNKLDKSTFDSYKSTTDGTLESLSTNKVNVSDYTTFANNTNSALSDLSTNKVETSAFDSYVNSTSSTLNALNTEKLDFTNLANSLVQGENITLTKDAANKTITISGSGGSKVQSNWTETDSSNPSFIQNKPTLGTMAAEDASNYTPSAGLSDVAISGSYNDLLNKPTIPEAQVNADWNATSGVSQILNKPTLFSGDYNDLTNKPDIPAAANNGTITITQGGVTKGSFTTDQATDATIDIDEVGSSLAAGNGININTNDEIDIMQEDKTEPDGYNWDFNTVGTLTENDGVYSGFSTSNYLSSKTTFEANLYASSLEIEINFTTGNTLPSGNVYQYLCCVTPNNYKYPAISLKNNRILFSYSTNGSNQDSIEANNITILTNTNYTVRIEYSNNSLTGTLTNNENQSVINLTSGTPSQIHITREYPASFWLGRTGDTGAYIAPFGGSINTRNSFVKVNGVMFQDITEHQSVTKPCAKATSSLYGLVKPDNDTITVSNGVIKVDQSALTSKQDALVSGTNIKTINNESLIGKGNIEIVSSGFAAPNIDNKETLTVGASGTTYTAPANGWFHCSFYGDNSNISKEDFVKLVNTTSGVEMNSLFADMYLNDIRGDILLPVNANDIVRLEYHKSATMNGNLLFYYA